MYAGRFELLEFLGCGGTASVYRAADHSLDETPVALKILPPRIAANPEDLKRFRNEVLTARTLTHRNIVAIYDFGSAADGSFFCSMELADGGTLGQYLAKSEGGFLPFPELIEVLTELLDGVLVASRKGVIHGDLKPENILLSGDGLVKLTDFGLSTSVHSTRKLSRNDETFGTPYYMAPEQFRGDELDARTDLYSIGLIAYELATGTRPFSANDYFEIANQHFHRPMPLIHTLRQDVPRWFQRFVECCSAKNPADRYDSPKEAIEWLKAHYHQDHGFSPQMLPNASGSTGVRKKTPVEPSKTVRNLRAARELVEDTHPITQQLQVLAQAHAGIGLENIKLGRIDEAVKHFRYAAQLDSTNPEYATFLGRALHASQNLTEAEQWFHSALRLDALYRNAYFYLGKLYHSTGKKDSALANLGTFLSLSKNNDNAELAIEAARMMRAAMSDSLH